MTSFKKASMSDQGDKAKPPTPSQAAVDQELESMPKRRITLTRKALQNTIDTKRREANIRRNKLQGLIHSLEQGGDYEEKCLHALEVTTEDYRFVVHELACLYEQDRFGEYNLDIALLAEEQKVINYARMIVRRIKNHQLDKLSETTSRRSKPQLHHSKSRSSVSTGSSVRLRALAKAAMAQENAEYERVIAEKELECSKREAEHAKELAILSANKKAAVANAKLRPLKKRLKRMKHRKEPKYRAFPTPQSKRELEVGSTQTMHQKVVARAREISATTEFLSHPRPLLQT